MSNDKQFIDFRKEVEKLKEIDGAEEYVKQLAHLFLGNGLSLQTILLMAIDFGQQHPQWIPVEDELPPKRKDPLVISDEVFIHTTGGHYLSAVYDYQDKQWIDVYSIETLESNEVTHWMEIQPPRKEE